MIELMVVLFDVFWMVSIVLLLWGADTILGMGMEFKNKGMMHCFREGKCQQGFTTGVCY